MDSATSIAPRFGFFAALVYVIIGQRFGEQFPFGPLSMFASDQAPAAGRVIVRRADGALAEVTDFDRWSCAEPLTFVTGPSPCSEGAHTEMDQRAADYVRAHAGRAGDGEPVTLVRRVFAIDAPGKPVRIYSCDLAPCTATSMTPR